jgi:hypothetical protein
MEEYIAEHGKPTKKVGTVIGECRIAPPSIVDRLQGDGDFERPGAWPEIRAKEWCGSWKCRQEGESQ